MCCITIQCYMCCITIQCYMCCITIQCYMCCITIQCYMCCITVPFVLYYSSIATIVNTLHLICIVGISKIQTFLSYGHCPVPWCLVKGGSTVLRQVVQCHVQQLRKAQLCFQRRPAAGKKCIRSSLLTQQYHT